MLKRPSMSRRQFVKTASLTGTGVLVLPSLIGHSLISRALGREIEIKLTGKVIRAGDAEAPSNSLADSRPSWDEARIGFAIAPDYDSHKPEAVVYAQKDEDIFNAIKYCQSKTFRGKPLALRPRSGRHNYEGFSSLAEGGVILDLSEYKGFKLNAAHTEATIGAGMRMHEIYAELGKYNLVLPLATGPTVGLAGLALGGGVGVTSRKYGTTADNLISLRIILANGQKVEATATNQYKDLFWACTGGGGGNVGVVTDFTFKVHKVGKVGIYNIVYPWSEFEQVMMTWQKWHAQAGPNFTCAIEMSSPVKFQEGTGFAPIDGYVNLYGQFTPDSDAGMKDFEPGLKMMIEGFHPVEMLVHEFDIQTANLLVLGLFDTDYFKTGVIKKTPEQMLGEYRKHQHFKSTSCYARRQATLEEIKHIRQLLENTPILHQPPSEPTMVQFLGGGEGLTKKSSTESPIPYRSAPFIFQLNGYWEDPRDRVATKQWVNHIREWATDTKANSNPLGQGLYINYVDNNVYDLNRMAFGEANHHRLLQVKHKYDPKNFFDHPKGWHTS